MQIPREVHFILLLCFSLFCGNNATANSSSSAWHPDSCSSCRCHHGLFHGISVTVNIADCSNQGLTEIPRDLPTDIQVLIASHNPIALNTNPNFPYAELKALVLHECKIKDIPQLAFSGLVSLQILDLHSRIDFIDHLDEDLFDELPKLQVLNISLSLNHVNNKKIALNSLKELNLNVDNVELPNGLLEGLNLETLHLRADKATELPSGILQAMIQPLQTARLKSVHIVSSSLRSLPEDLLDEFLDVLEIFHLKVGFMTRLPDDLFVQSNRLEMSLKEIQLSGVAEISADLFYHLDQLEVLYIVNFHILSPEAFNGLSFLKELTLLNSTMAEIHEDLFWDVDNLLYLKISNTRISFVNSITLNGQRNMEHLDLSSNEIATFDENTLWRMGDILELDLSRNRIEELGEYVFERESLLKIDISSNLLVSLPPNVFSNGYSDNLMEIDLSNNNIQSLPEGLFDGLSKIELIDLSGNELEELPIGLFSENQLLQKVDMSDNKIMTLSDLFLSDNADLILDGNPVVKSPTFSALINGKTDSHNIETKLEDELLLIKASSDIISSSHHHVSCSSCICHDGIYAALPMTVKIADCSNRGLTEIPNDLPSDIQVLIASHNHIGLKPNPDFPYEELKALILHECKIKYIPQLAFSGLSNLQILDLHSSDDIIVLLDDNPLAGLPRLQVLNISLSLNYINMDKIALKSLNELNIDVFNADLPNNFLEGLNLETLYLRADKATALPSGILQAMLQPLQTARLRTLHITSTSLRSLPVDLLHGFLETLEIFHLNVGYINHLPTDLFVEQYSEEGSGESLDAEKSLKELRLSGIAEISANLFTNLALLEVLFIVNFHVISPEAFNGLSSLKELTLQSSTITEIHEYWFWDVDELLYLKISNTKISHIDRSVLHNQRYMKHMDLSGNEIVTFNEDTLWRMKDIRELDLSRNRIEQLGETVFTQETLIRIDLSSNQLKEFPSDIFNSGYSDNIVEINLAYNNFKTLPEGLFDGLPNVRWIDLSGNELEELPFGLFSENYHLQEVDMSDNKLKLITDLSLPAGADLILNGNPLYLPLPSEPSNNDGNVKDEPSLITPTHDLTTASKFTGFFRSIIQDKYITETNFPTTSAPDKDPKLEESKQHQDISTKEWFKPLVGTLAAAVIVLLAVVTVFLIVKKRRAHYSRVYVLNKAVRDVGAGDPGMIPMGNVI